MSKAKSKNKSKFPTPEEQIKAGQTVYALIYCRVSTTRQAVEGSGLESQEQRCTQYALQKGYVVEKVFRDDFTGAGDFMNRPAMSSMLGYVDGKPYRNYVVIFDDLKRFARDVEFHIKLRATFRARGITPECLNFSFNDSPEGKYVEVILAAGNELEREQNKRQVMQKQASRLEDGYWAFGSKKGYKMTLDPLSGKNISIPTKEGLEMLKPALELFASGELRSKVDVCRFLIEKGFWTKQRAEKYIDKISMIMKDIFYAGYIEYPAWEITRRTGRHMGIISMEKYELVQKRLRKEDSGIRVRQDLREDFELRGLLVCEECGGHISAAWTKGRTKKSPYYRCQNHKCPLHKKSSLREDVRAGFMDILQKHRLKPEVSGLLNTVFDRVWSAELEGWRKDQMQTMKIKSEAEEQISHLIKLSSATRVDSVRLAYEKEIELLMNALNECDGDVDQDLAIPYRTALNKVSMLLENPYKIWSTSDVREKHELFFFIFEEKLTYHQKTGYRTGNIPSYIRLFEEFVTTNSHDVEMAGVEPACK